MGHSGAAIERLRDRVLDAARSTAPVNIRGGGTKLFYGEAPRGTDLDVRELCGITSYEPTELVVTVRGGTSLAELESALSERGQCLPFEPPRFGSTGTVGGMVAAGLSGPARAAVGPLRDFVLGVTVLCGRGELLTFGGQVMKNVAGYDISRVFAGSLGILGVICEVSLKVMPVPPASRTLMLECEEAAALARMNRWSAKPFPLNASAWHRGRLALRLAGAKAAVDLASAGFDGAVELEPSAAQPWWSAVRDQRHEFFVRSIATLDAGECLWRIAVPDSAPPLAVPGDQFIEWGGAQRWFRSAAPAVQIRAIAAAAGGHATLMRAADKSPGVFTSLSEAARAIHRRLKRSFDPAGIFNPGRLYPDL